MKTILELSPSEARDFFLKEKSYSSIDLPPYFSFQKLLSALSINKTINGINLGNAKKLDDVNYKFLTNKDGKYAWRPLQLINPAIYVYLVDKITEQKNWELIVEQFKKFQKNERIKCCSIPVVSDENENKKAKNITNWCQQIGQQSLEMALNYDCFLNTDVTDCYGAIYTHTIVWALHGKKIGKAIMSMSKKEKREYLGNNIDETIQSMQNAQTNGIPQGSVLMDFIAEMVLGYSDLLLFEKIEEYNKPEEKYKIENYQILRYRDDYRIFANNQETLVKIAKILTETLIDLNFKLNTQKTFVSDNIVRDVIKPDKLYWNEAKKGEKTLQKHLFLIHSLAEKYPNSGSLAIALDKFLNRVYPLKLFKEENTKVLCSILVDIAYKNPRTYPIITAILSKILSLEVNTNVIKDILDSIKNKFERIPNVGHLQIWVQRLTLKTDENRKYEEKLCKKVVENTVAIWNIDWLPQVVQDIFTNGDNSIVEVQKIEDMSQIIEPEEVRIFNNY
ncbi:MAG: RNA-directed DNA polymerase [Bacteroidales bacterium]|jgi:hypothetical protein|nr:RNA-directed DNA polymerase [Bacteroidales bacterium]